MTVSGPDVDVPRHGFSSTSPFLLMPCIGDSSIAAGGGVNMRRTVGCHNVPRMACAVKGGRFGGQGADFTVASAHRTPIRFAYGRMEPA